jgi:2-polyprenyl-3-methyl-5-hydroxy-6-metoxy-1,4-benzoquinol methylase
MSRLDRLDTFYNEFHRLTARAGFVYGGEERAELFSTLVGGPGRRVLDVGCRDGALTSAYAVENDIVGMDVDRLALRGAREKLGIETVWHDADEPLPFANESFDVVVVGELLEHLVSPSGFIEEAWRVLRPGGTLVGSIPNAYRLKNRLRFLAGRPIEDNPTHLHLIGEAELRRLLEGFEEVDVRFISSRVIRLHERLFANIIVFAGRRPLAQGSAYSVAV